LFLTVIIYKAVGWKEIGVHTTDQSLIIYLWSHQSIKRNWSYQYEIGSDDGVVDVVHEKLAKYIYIR
jgi:hypothetical protein